MSDRRSLSLQPRTAGGGTVETTATGWRLRIPAGGAATYRLAQLDDYAGLPRRAFPWRPPLRFEVRARLEGEALPGTWGFGLWNDPFALGLGFGGQSRLPAPPQALWCFGAAPANHLNLGDGPGHGWLAMSVRSHPSAGWVALLGLPFAPLALWPPFACRLRPLAAQLMQQAVHSLPVSPHETHTYTILWLPHEARFAVDGQTVLRTPITPRPPLGLVLWVDNQYLAYTPQGKLRWGLLPQKGPTTLHLEVLTLESPGAGTV